MSQKNDLCTANLCCPYCKYEYHWVWQSSKIMLECPACKQYFKVAESVVGQQD